MKKYLLMVLVSLVGYWSHAQTFQKQTLIYTDTLGLDLFVPDNKSNDQKPLLIYVHGGGFSGGERDHADHIAFCERYAKRGWVTATISYHLTMKGKSFSCDQAVQHKINTIFTAAQNIHQAVKFLIDHEQSIDPSRVVLAGSSAGAEAVVQAVYWDKTKKDILSDDFKYAGMISMAGALLDERWVTSDSAIPSAFFHGTCDSLVPYGNAPHHYCEADETGFMMLYGGYSLAMKLESINQQYFMVTDCGGGHEWASKPIAKDYIHYIDDFLENGVLKSIKRQSHLVLSEGEGDCTVVEVCR
ncbi:MAG: alpha/beta hydrolase [Marinoscillum sp.]